MFCGTYYQSNLLYVSEYDYNIALPPNLENAGNEELEWARPQLYVPDLHSSKAYDIYKEYGVIDSLINDFNERLSNAESNYSTWVDAYDRGDIERMPRPQPFWDFLRLDFEFNNNGEMSEPETITLMAQMKLYSMAPNIRFDGTYDSITTSIIDFINGVLVAYGEFEIVSITKKNKGLKLRRR